MTVRDLLAQATARPWEGSWPVDQGGAVLTRGGYVQIAQTTLGADAELIVRAVNEYECLLDLEDFARLVVSHYASLADTPSHLVAGLGKLHKTLACLAGLRATNPGETI